MKDSLSYTDIFNKTIELEDDRIILSKAQDKRGPSYKSSIPYSEVKDINFQKGNFFNAGIFSLITANSGISFAHVHLTPKETGMVFEDRGTFLFEKADIERINGIIEAINEKRLAAEKGDNRKLLDIDELNGYQFEAFCAELLRENRFTSVQLTPQSGDQGVDILAEKQGVKYAFQCKHYSSPLGNTPIQEVNAGKTFYRCHVGVVITNSFFTPGAVALAEATGVLLWDRENIEKMMS